MYLQNAPKQVWTGSLILKGIVLVNKRLYNFKTYLIENKE